MTEGIVFISQKFLNISIFLFRTSFLYLIGDKHGRGSGGSLDAAISLLGSKLQECFLEKAEFINTTESKHRPTPIVANVERLIDAMTGSDDVLYNLLTFY
jgi:hypothetical protein